MKKAKHIFKMRFTLTLGIVFLIGLLTAQAMAADAPGLYILAVKHPTNITATISNSTVADVSADFILAVYEPDGKLKYNKDFPVTVAANSTTSQVFSYDVAANPNCTYKLFAWDPVSLVPVCKEFKVGPPAVLFENGQWAPELGEITVQTPRSVDGHYMWSYEDGMIRITNDINAAVTTSSIPFRWQFQNTIDIRGYAAVVLELDEVPTGIFLRKLRFRIDEDSITSNAVTSKIVRLTSFTDNQRLRGVGALPSYGQVVKIKKVYLEGTGIIAQPAAVGRREIRDVLPPRTGNTPVKAITTSPQYTGTVTWSPDHATFQENTVYTATIRLAPRPGWTLSGVAANWYRLYDISGTDATNTLTHAAGASVITKTFAATTPVIPYPEPTQFLVLSYDDTISPETNDLLDVLDSLNIKANFFTIGMNLEKSNRFPEYARVVSRLKNDGHEPGNHTWQHERWTRAQPAVRLSDWTANHNYMNQLFGKYPTWIRFPYNDNNAGAVADAGSLGLANLWGFDTNDWSIDRSASYLINRVLTQTGNNAARDGQIYVHHDHYDGQNSTRYALPEVAHYFRSRGIDFMTASELSRRNNITVTPGLTYNNFFRPSTITIGTQPAVLTNVTQGAITANLSVTATVAPNATLSYQWYSATFDGAEAIPGATGAAFAIPKNSDAGTHYYYCKVSAPNATPVTSRVVTVNVAASSEGTVSISYNPNGGVGAVITDNVPINSQYQIKEDTLFVRQYYIFIGWNTAADGAGLWYYPGYTITAANNLTLFAQWFSTEIG